MTNTLIRDPLTLEHLEKLLKEAESRGIHIQITGSGEVEAMSMKGRMAVVPHGSSPTQVEAIAFVIDVLIEDEKK